MVFTVTYRDKTGARREECVEAESRDAVFAAMKARGIVPTAVRAGAKKPRNTRNTRNAAFPYIIAAAFVLLLGGGVWWWFGRAGARPSRVVDVPAKYKAMPKEVKPAHVIPKPKPVQRETQSATKEEKRTALLKKLRDRYGDNIPANLKPTMYFLENPPQKTFHPARSKSSIFKRPSERDIAEILSVEPGTWFMRRPTFDDRFDADFRASLSENIEFKETDTDEQRVLKQMVVDAKAELSERMAAGEKPSDAMNSYASAMYELGQYRSTLQEELSKIKHDASYTDQDVQDFVNAANKLLKDKGLQPIKMPKTLFRHVGLKKAAQKAAAKAKENVQ